jgi:hypothetical protein
MEVGLVTAEELPVHLFHVQCLGRLNPNVVADHDCLVPGRNGPGLAVLTRGAPATCVVVLSSDESDEFLYLISSEET